MPLIAGYLLKLSLSLSVVYLFYILVLRRLTFYTCNRWYLLGYSLLAFFIPFVNISPVLEQGNWDKSVILQFIPAFEKFNATRNANLPEAAFSWWWYALAGAMIGILLMAVRFILRYISYYRIRRGAQLLVDDGVKVYHVDRSIIPFSFGNAIFINREQHAEEDLRQIIHHEFIHVKQKHTIDILWGELLCMLNWYNPFAWLIRKAIRQNLEFIADNKVLENGIDKKHYQYLLLKVTGAAHFSITQQFNFSSLKKRIIMMNRSRSAKIQLTRFLFLLPLLTVSLLAFRTTVIEQKRVHDVAASAQLSMDEFLTAKLAAVTDTVPAKEKPDQLKELLLKKNPSIKNMTWEKAAWSASEPSLVVFRRDGTTEKYDWSDQQARELFRKRYGMLPTAPTKDQVALIWRADSVKEVMIDASLNGPGNPNRTNDFNNTLIVIDGVVQKNGTASLNELPAEKIQTMSVLKGNDAIAIYGDAAKGKSGVIDIRTRPSVRISGRLTEDTVPNLHISGEVVTSNDDSTVLKGNPSIKVRKASHIPVRLYVVDGIEFSPKEFEELDLDPNRIESVTILKGESGIKLYGEKAKDGVIIIKLKKVVTIIGEKPDSTDRTSIFNTSEKPIWHINGYTYAVATGAMGKIPGHVNSVIVNDKLYTAEEANQLFKKSQFRGVAVLNTNTALQHHGINSPVMVLTENASELNKYQVGNAISQKPPRP